jgi:hypothetical protein
MRATGLLRHLLLNPASVHSQTIVLPRSHPLRRWQTKSGPVLTATYQQQHAIVRSQILAFLRRFLYTNDYTIRGSGVFNFASCGKSYCSVERNLGRFTSPLSVFESYYVRANNHLSQL